MQQCHCEELYDSGRVEEARDALLTMIDTFGKDIRANKEAEDWVVGGYRRVNYMNFHG